jgi:hypothetical protein
VAGDCDQSLSTIGHVAPIETSRFPGPLQLLASLRMTCRLLHPGNKPGSARCYGIARTYHQLVAFEVRTQRRLGISVKTAENRRGRGLDKLDVRSYTELGRYSLRKALLD